MTTNHRGSKKSVRFIPGRLKKARTQLGLTAAELAEKAGYDPRTVWRAENGHRNQKKVAQDLCDALNEAGADQIRLGDLILDVSDIYIMPGNNRFEREGDHQWVEYKDDREFARFDEFSIDTVYLTLVCTKRITEDGRRMLVRIPVHVGEVSWTWENPLDWGPFTVGRPE